MDEARSWPRKGERRGRPRRGSRRASPAGGGIEIRLVWRLLQEDRAGLPPGAATLPRAHTCTRPRRPGLLGRGGPRAAARACLRAEQPKLSKGNSEFVNFGWFVLSFRPSFCIITGFLAQLQPRPRQPGGDGQPARRSSRFRGRLCRRRWERFGARGPQSGAAPLPRRLGVHGPRPRRRLHALCCRLPRSSVREGFCKPRPLHSRLLPQRLISDFFTC